MILGKVILRLIAIPGERFSWELLVTNTPHLEEWVPCSETRILVVYDDVLVIHSLQTIHSGKSSFRIQLVSFPGKINRRNVRGWTYGHVKSQDQALSFFQDLVVSEELFLSMSNPTLRITCRSLKCCEFTLWFYIWASVNSTLDLFPPLLWQLEPRPEYLRSPVLLSTGLKADSFLCYSLNWLKRLSQMCNMLLPRPAETEKKLSNLKSCCSCELDQLCKNLEFKLIKIKDWFW